MKKLLLLTLTTMCLCGCGTNTSSSTSEIDPQEVHKNIIYNEFVKKFDMSSKYPTYTFVIETVYFNIMFIEQVEKRENYCCDYIQATKIIYENGGVMESYESGTKFATFNNVNNQISFQL